MLLLPPPAFAAALSASLLLGLAAHAQVSSERPDTVGAEAVAACEKAARQSLAGQGGRPTEVTFNAAPSVAPRLASDSRIVLNGAGRWRGASGVRTFDYSCNVDLSTPGSVGLVMRDSTRVAQEAATPRTPLEPNLSRLSPEACESSAAAALKRRWPRVSQISFDSASRTVVQESAGQARLHGHGRALAAPGSPTTHFGFDCEIDPRDGRVLSTRVSG